ncbi:hypothetical protein J5491_01400 [Candidatus Saccharibacteria bacterium]|nr:hypothetical protein [Candidatus Saccharibacteria bacterium]
MDNHNEQPTASQAKTPKKKGNKKNLIITIVTIVILCVIAGVIAFVIINNNNKNNIGGEGDDSQGQRLSEEERKETEDTLKQYAEVTIEGYKDIDNPDTEKNKAVVVKVKNISKETTSIAATIGAYDRDGNLLETSSTYAEGLEPDQSVIFNTFIYTELTEDQLSSATFKVFTAKTYTAEGLVEETGEGTEEPAEEQAPAESESTETNENQ